MSVTLAPTVLVEAPHDSPFASQIHGTWAEVRSTLLVNCLMGFWLLVFFELRRNRRSIFGPRLRTNTSSKLRTMFRAGIRIPFGWLQPLFSLSDDELAATVGLDAYFVLRFTKLWRRLFLLASVAAFIFLIPFYRRASHRRKDFFRITIANAQGNKRALWSAFLFVYIWTGMVLASLEAEARHYLERRKIFLATTIDQTRCSVLLERIPPKVDGESLAMYLGDLLGDIDAVFTVVIYERQLTAKLTNAVTERHNAALRLQQALLTKTNTDWWCSLFTGRKIQNEHRRAAKVVHAASRLDALDAVCAALATNADHHTTYTSNGSVVVKDSSKISSKKATTSSEIAESSKILTSLALAREAMKDSCCCWIPMKSTAKHTHAGQLRTGIASLRSPGLTGDASQLALSSEPLGLTATLAPSPADIIWSNCATPVEAVGLRRAIADVALGCSALALTPIVSGFQLVSNLDEISRFVPAFRPLFENHPLLASLVTGYVPVILLLALFMIVPLALEQLAKHYIRFKSRSAVQAYMLPRFFAFQMLAIYVTVLAGSLASTLQQLVAQGPNAILTLLGRAVPSAGPYFLQYLIVKLCFSLPLELARPAPYLMADVLRKSRKLLRKIAGRPRQDNLEEPAKTMYGTSSPSTNNKTRPTDLKIGYYVVPELLMVVALGSLCAATAPLVTVLAWLYFAFADAVYTRQFLFVYENTHDSGARDVWPALHRSAVYALVVAHLATLSTLYLLGGRIQALLLAPLPVLVHTFYVHFLKPYYIDPASSLDRHTARITNLYNPLNTINFDPNFYRHPSLTEANLALNSHTVARAMSADSTQPCQGEPRTRDAFLFSGDTTTTDDDDYDTTSGNDDDSDFGQIESDDKTLQILPPAGEEEEKQRLLRQDDDGKEDGLEMLSVL